MCDIVLNLRSEPCPKPTHRHVPSKRRKGTHSATADLRHFSKPATTRFRIRLLPCLPYPPAKGLDVTGDGAVMALGQTVQLSAEPATH